MVARRLGPELRGYYGLVLMAVTLVGAFGHLGIGASISYHTGKKAYPRNEILSFLVIGSLLLGFSLAAVFMIIYPRIPGIWSEIPRHIMLIGLIAVPFTFLHNFLNRFLLGMLRVRQRNISRLLHNALYFALVLALVWVLGGGLIEVVLAFMISILLAALLTLAIFTRDIMPLGRLRADLIKPFVIYGFQVYLVFVFNYLNHRFDIILIKHFLTASDVSFYQIPVNICERLWQVPNAMASILFPTLLALEQGSGEFTAKICRVNFILMIILGGAIALAAPIFVPLLYGREYLPMIPALYSVIWGIVISPIATFLGVYFASRKQISRNIFASGMGFLVNIVLNMILIPRIGIVGAGIATSISNTTWAIILAIFFIRQEESGPGGIFILNRNDISELRDKIRGLIKSKN
jgi:O-antigen/teichoic acid export membrane protein